MRFPGVGNQLGLNDLLGGLLLSDIVEECLRFINVMIIIQAVGDGRGGEPIGDGALVGIGNFVPFNTAVVLRDAFLNGLALNRLVPTVGLLDLDIAMFDLNGIRVTDAAPL